MSRELELPSPSPAWFLNGFHAFLPRYLRRHFHAIAVTESSLRRTDLLRSPRSAGEEQRHADQPLVVQANHPSWWDPLIAQFINRQLFGQRAFHAPIDAQALSQYQVFKKLGFFGIDSSGRKGATKFLKVSRGLMQRKEVSLFVTPEGRFADVRDHDAALQPGLTHLCHTASTGHVLAMAMEYQFWDERLPVCLIHFSDPLSLRDDLASKTQWQARLAEQLRSTQSELSALAIDRVDTPFKNLLPGRKGAGGVYQVARTIKSWFTQKPLSDQHGNQFG